MKGPSQGDDSLCRLDASEDEVADLECPLPDVSTVIPAQHLLVFCQSEEGDIACFVDLIHGVFESSASLPCSS